MNHERSIKSVKRLGNDFEDHIEKILQDPLDGDVLSKIKSGAEGADFIYNIKKDGAIISNILIECKNPVEMTAWKKPWVTKIISNAVKTGSKYKFIVTDAYPSVAKQNLPYWIEDQQNHVYVVRPGFIKVIISSVTTLGPIQLIRGMSTRKCIISSNVLDN